jgi:hypothetical protein
MYVAAPHGVYPIGVIFNFILNPAYSHVKVMTSSLLFNVPIVREFSYLAGASPATTINIIDHLDQERDVLITPEGLRAILHYNEENGVMKVICGDGSGNHPRKGFIRCATNSVNRARIRIVPTWIEGEKTVYTVWNGGFFFQWLRQKMLASYKYPFPVFAFGWWGSFWPKPRPLTFYYGTPISLESRSVDDIFLEYCDSMKGLIKAANHTQKQATHTRERSATH